MAAHRAHGKLRRDEDGGVITITLTRDEKRNALDGEMFEAIEEAAEDLATESAHRVLVITGEGSYFTAGMDLAMGALPGLGVGSDGVARSSLRRLAYRRNQRHDFFDKLEQIEKPVVMAAQGHCLGWGIEMGSSCDFRFAAEGVRFSLPELPKLGMLPGSGGISRLTRLVGPHWAKWLLVGESISAEQAKAIGFLHDVYPADGFAASVREFAQRLAALPGEALGLGLLNVDAAVHADRRLARDVDRLAYTAVMASAEFADSAMMRHATAPGSLRPGEDPT
jgi:enoyl-CoA hydratase/carnithine racemase